MRFRLRTLMVILVILVILPPALAGALARALAGMWYAVTLWPGVVASVLLSGLVMCLHALRSSENR